VRKDFFSYNRCDCDMWIDACDFYFKFIENDRLPRPFKYCPYCSKELKRTDDEKLLNKIFNEPI